jgi:hypothetical protein
VTVVSKSPAAYRIDERTVIHYQRVAAWNVAQPLGLPGGRWQA